MSPEKAKELVSLYPPLFLRDSFYFECGDGWFDLLKDCILEIKEELTNNPWPPDEFYDGPPVVNQIKEKYGSLRFYMSQENDVISSAILIAEDRSKMTCESCGKDAIAREKNGWRYTLCDECIKCQ